MTHLSKTNYITWRDCKKNAWLKIHKSEVYFANSLSDFEKQIIEAGNEVDLLAREIFPHAQFQTKFESEQFLVITDIIEEKSDGLHLYEVKATNEIDKKTHYHDLTFQVNVLESLGKKVLSANLAHLNKDYVRKGDLDLQELFQIEDVTETVRQMQDEVREEMDLAFAYLNQKDEPKGPCDCLNKGRSAHCTTFSYSNPNVPEYSVHDLARIGLSKRKLTELVDSNIFDIDSIPEDLKLSEIQENQIWTHKHDRPILSKENISEVFSDLEFPLHFLDYETFPSAIPRFSGYSPYQQIPFQYSLHILDTPEAEPRHLDFLHTSTDDPTEKFADSLMNHVLGKGHVVVWHKGFELGRNKEVAERYPNSAKFFANLEDRVFDLEDIFKKQYYVHKDFRGSSSIKKVLPVLAPDLNYKDLNISEGGSAAEAWNRLITDNKIGDEEKEQIKKDLEEYCRLDTYAMYRVWKALLNLIS